MKNLQYAKCTEIVFLQKTGLCLRLLSDKNRNFIQHTFFLTALSNLLSCQLLPANTSAFNSFSISITNTLIQTHIIRLLDYCQMIPTGQSGSNLYPAGSKQIHLVYCLQANILNFLNLLACHSFSYKSFNDYTLPVG